MCHMDGMKGTRMREEINSIRERKHLSGFRLLMEYCEVERVHEDQSQ